ncbi:hypothetical protein IW150_002375 [Coemansia sp. RSA 2607]|nr:hypothetical protein IW150_002375 [Coemansia sp. RSA 2607]
MIFNSPYPDIPAYLPQSLPSFIFNFSKEHSAFGSNGDLVAMTDGSDSLTFNQVRTTSIQFASGLVNIVGLQRNDVVLVLIPNSPYYAPVLFGAQMAGLVCATGNPEYTEGEIAHMLKLPTLSKYDLSSIVFISSAAAPLSRETQTEAQKRLGCIVIQGYGMSEASPVTHRAPTENVVVGSAGYLMPSMQCKIIDDAGNLLGHSQVGEICMRGPNIMVGYLNNAAATVQAIDKDGFIHSGDIGYVDNNGCYYILDRKKELIKYKGFQVAPAELEGILMDHPAVLDAAVIPVYNKAQETEIPKAYVVVKPEFITSTLTHDIANWISLRVSSYKTLRGGVEIVRSIPKSASGKILRRLLREREAVRNSNNTQSAKL